MATILQKRLAKEIIKNLKAKKPKNNKELVISSGYGAVTASSHSHIILRQKGVQEALEEDGFTTANAKRVVGRILNHGKEENQIKAADMILKVNGEYAAEKHVNLNIEAESNDEISSLTTKLNEVYRNKTD